MLRPAGVSAGPAGEDLIQQPGDLLAVARERRPPQHLGQREGAARVAVAAQTPAGGGAQLVEGVDEREPVLAPAGVDQLARLLHVVGRVALVQLVFVGFFGQSNVWAPVFWVLAALSMTVGNLVALRQTNMIRMLAYSSIAQGGFILMPLAFGLSPTTGPIAATKSETPSVSRSSS